MDFVDGVGDGVQSSVESEGHVRRGEIVVDGLGNANDLHPLQEKFVADFLRAVAADADDGVNAELARVGNHLIGNIADFSTIFARLVLERIAAAGGSEDGATAGQDSRNFLERKLKRLLRPDKAVKAIGDANDLPFVL